MVKDNLIISAGDRPVWQEQLRNLDLDTKLLPEWALLIASATWQ